MKHMVVALGVGLAYGHRMAEKQRRTPGEVVPTMMEQLSTLPTGFHRE